MPDVQGAILTEFRGTVTIQKKGDTYTIHPEDINTEKAIISHGAILSTETDSRADLQFTTGVSMRVGPGTKIKVEKSQVLTGENFTKVLLYLEKGSLYTKAPKLQGTSTVAITAPSAAAMVRGTEFYIEEINNKNTTIVLEGSIHVQVSASGEEKILEMGKKSEITKKDFQISDLTEKDLAAIREKGGNIAVISDSQKQALIEILKSSEEQKQLLEETRSDYKNLKNKPPENTLETKKQSNMDTNKGGIKTEKTQRVRDEEEFGRVNKKPEESSGDKTAK
jgi:hypothetical protein